MNPETKRGSGRRRPLCASDPGFASMRAGCGGTPFRPLDHAEATTASMRRLPRVAPSGARSTKQWMHPHRTGGPGPPLVRPRSFGVRRVAAPPQWRLRVQQSSALRIPDADCACPARDSVGGRHPFASRRPRHRVAYLERAISVFFRRRRNAELGPADQPTRGHLAAGTGASPRSRTGPGRHSRNPRRHQARRHRNNRAAVAHLPALRPRTGPRSRRAVARRMVPPARRKHLHRVAGSGAQCQGPPPGGHLAGPGTNVFVASRSRAPLRHPAKIGGGREFDLRTPHFNAPIDGTFPLASARLRRAIHLGTTDPARNSRKRGTWIELAH